MISVVIPLYNKEKIIDRTLRSVLSQDYDDYEIVIVDDGSTDNSVEIVKNLLNLQNLRDKVRLISQKNSGPSKARNFGVKNARGEWIVFLDADDELMEHALSNMMSEVGRYPDADIIDFPGYFRNSKECSLHHHPLIGRVKNPLKMFFFRDISPGCGHSIFKSDFVRLYPYDERLRRFEDYEILLRMLPNAKVYSSQIPTVYHNIDFAEASNARKNINDDYVGHLKMEGPFWKRMCVFRIFIEEREHYSEQCHRLYPLWYWRYDLLFIMKMLNKICR